MEQWRKEMYNAFKARREQVIYKKLRKAYELLILAEEIISDCKDEAEDIFYDMSDEQKATEAGELAEETYDKLDALLGKIGVVVNGCGDMLY
jgi:hypothetical protein